MSAADNVSMAQDALNIVNQLIQLEAADEADDQVEGSTGDSDDATDVETLRSVADGLTSYITATTKEVGTPDDLEDLAEEQSAAAKVDAMIRGAYNGY